MNFLFDTNVPAPKKFIAFTIYIFDVIYGHGHIALHCAMCTLQPHTHTAYHVYIPYITYGRRVGSLCWVACTGNALLTSVEQIIIIILCPCAHSSGNSTKNCHKFFPEDFSNVALFYFLLFIIFVVCFCCCASGGAAYMWWS